MTTKINASTAGLTETVDISGILEFQTANTTALIIDASQNINCASTGAITVPVGTTAQRPSSAVNGMLRYCTDNAGGSLEGYVNGNWVVVRSGAYSVSYLIVAGGGGSAGDYGGGGGAGGLLSGSGLALTPGTTYSFVVGAGGSGGTSSRPSFGVAGSNSTALGFTAIGGGRSTGYATGSGNAGGSGGSGGGGGASDSTTAAGSGTAGQGNNGGTGGYFGGGNYAGGGGGGAGAVGTNAAGASGGAGGAGSASSITGSSVTYAAGGTGGGMSTGTGAAGTANTGNGAGGGGYTYGGNTGGSGVVIISVPTLNYTGTTTGSPTVTTSGSFTILKYTTSGTYTA